MPVDKLRLSDPITPEYQAEVDETMRRAEVRYKQMLATIDRAERRRDRIQKLLASKSHSVALKKELAVLDAELELRREELRRMSSMMQSSPASASHRGDRSFRPVPEPKTL